MKAGVKQAVLRVLPATALKQALKARGQSESEAGTFKPLDLSRLEYLRKADLDILADPTRLESEILPKLGFNDELLYQFPEELYEHSGSGLLHWQYPNQFSKYLADLAEARVETYLEIGARHGGTFLITCEYLQRFHPIRKAVAVDLGTNRSLQEYSRLNPRATYVRANSQSLKFERFVHRHAPFDLVLIDGDHTADGCRRDFETVKDAASIIVFHDIVSEPTPGVRAVWQEVKAAHQDTFDFKEYTDQYKEVLDRSGSTYFGIGVARRRDRVDGVSTGAQTDDLRVEETDVS